MLQSKLIKFLVAVALLFGIGDLALTFYRNTLEIYKLKYGDLPAATDTAKGIPPPRESLPTTIDPLTGKKHRDWQSGN